MNQQFYDAMEESPVIAAVKDFEGLEKCCRIEEIRVVFILFGDVCNIDEIVRKVREKGEIAMVHIDLISGLGSKEIAVDFIKKHTEANGIISTKPLLVKRAKELGLYTILRFFIIDSMAFENISKQCHLVKADFIEILPGVMPKIIKKICKMGNIPVIAGGLVMDKEDVMAALSAGAISVSTTNQDVWLM